MDRWAASAHGGVGEWWPCWRRSREGKEGKGGRRRSQGEEEGAGREEEEGGEDSALHVQFPSSAAYFFARDSGGVCRQAGTRAGRGTCWKHLRRGLGETWAPISLPSPTHQLRAHPAYFLVWPWSLAPRSFFIHINVEVSSHGAGVVCASSYCSLI